MGKNRATVSVPPSEEIADAVAKDRRSVSRLARHLQAGAVGARGHQLSAKLVRTEFWTRNLHKQMSERQTNYTVRTYGWSARELRDLLVAACDQDRTKRVLALRARQKKEKERTTCT